VPHGFSVDIWITRPIKYLNPRIMKVHITRLLIPIASLLTIFSCHDSAPVNEAWPKYGYLFTRNYNLDTVYVIQEGSAVRTVTYSKKYPLDDNSKKWTIQLPAS